MININVPLTIKQAEVLSAYIDAFRIAFTFAEEVTEKSKMQFAVLSEVKDLIEFEINHH